ncbi:hypothetical protein PC116_g19695 [Phytophthora cactorum]|nr:hypothetical protein PC114_g15131 [Phytophthora cactorum]KAG3000908.1 hypothetical protein PC120_g20596 [Phytophthora cactorum]KAG3006672.1 hypothetical protein PC119_g14887 [Phytophthora cactorum]KAG4232054.1 hypothetical protein PC116_g19695 [Phytophthora cactorum]
MVFASVVLRYRVCAALDDHPLRVGTQESEGERERADTERDTLGEDDSLKIHTS